MTPREFYWRWIPWGMSPSPPSEWEGAVLGRFNTNWGKSLGSWRWTGRRIATRSRTRSLWSWRWSIWRHPLSFLEFRMYLDVLLEYNRGNIGPILVPRDALHFGGIFHVEHFYDLTALISDQHHTIIVQHQQVDPMGFVPLDQLDPQERVPYARRDYLLSFEAVRALTPFTFHQLDTILIWMTS